MLQPLEHGALQGVAVQQLLQLTVWISQPLVQVLAQPPQAGAASQHGAGLQHFTFFTWHLTGLQGLQHFFLPASAEPVVASSIAASAKIIPSRRIVSSLQSNDCRRPEPRPTGHPQSPENHFQNA